MPRESNAFVAMFFNEILLVRKGQYPCFAVPNVMLNSQPMRNFAKAVASTKQMPE